ncbi:MAG TPA: hypothetical protein VGE36_14230 [Roseateles sp.]
MGETNSSGDWSSWVQNVAAGVIGKASDARWVQPYTTEQMRLQALGQAGYGYYTEGQRQGAVGSVALNGNGNMLLLAGAAVVVLLLLKRK